ncbi:uncharacterized protein LOC133743714 [Rosa rugosa]|uniref:uncharacterized protein LOC133743714 n=1 Tax=Rosa rugosa TaxID=74645 RepID=UPI002B411EC5|nr:uncharacterized protein LOC133743714 [Rosa rugosa]
MNRLLAKFRHNSEEEEARRLANEAAIVAAAVGYEMECSDQPRQRGSRPGRSPNVDRLRESRGKDLMEDYFVEHPVFPDSDFRQRYRMHRPLFESILTAVTQYDDYFIQKADALGVLGLSPHQKLTCALRMLAYGAGANQCAEITRMGDSTALKSLKRFCRAIEGIYTSYYLRSPTPEDLHRLLKKARRRGFPGMLGSIDCMHWQWKNCPTAWAGAYSGRKGYPTIILEAVASYDTYIWHAFFGVPGSCNDLNVLGQSPVFNDLTAGVAPRFKYKVNQKDFDMGYYLADGIYPKWHTFVKTIPRPINEMQQHFSKKQEGYRKDVERCFGILQARFAILRGGARLFKKETLRSVMMTCIILHNMIVEDERIDDESDLECDVDGIDSMSLDVVEEYEQPRNALPFEPVRVGVNGDNLPGFMDRYDLVRDEYVHQILQENLVEHNWKIKTGGE